jgi:hypothetical protein
MARYILSDPNFSDGTHNEVIEQIVSPFRDHPGLKLIGYKPDPDFDRLPIELLGRPEAMMEALLEAAGKAYELSDMEKQHGHHPRIGAVDTKLAERPPRRRPSGGWTALEPRPNKHWRILQKEYPEGGDPGGARGFEQDRLDPRKEPSGDAQ